jgi:hypothetical protein
LNCFGLAQLKQLEMFQIQLTNEANLRSLKSNSVKTLQIRPLSGQLSEETVIALSSNCPNVVSLEIMSENDAKPINWCLKNFKQLKAFTCVEIDEEYAFPEGLKQLKIISLELSVDLYCLFGCIVRYAD